MQTTTSSSTLDVIGQVYSSSIRRELNEINFENREHHFHCKGYVSSANYSAKRGTYIFFINRKLSRNSSSKTLTADINFRAPDRLVDCTALKRNLEAFYASILPKGGAPFIYLALNIHPSRVDVNVSPTKSEVHFLDQEDIIEVICEEMQKKLSSANQSRSFNVQTLLPGTSHLNTAGTGAKPPSTGPRPTSTSNRLPPQKLVRTDAKAQTLDSMINFTASSRPSKEHDSGLSEKAKGKRKALELVELDEDGNETTPNIIDDDEEETEENGDMDSARSKFRDSDQPTAVHTASQPNYARRTKIPICDCDLTSIQELRASLTKNKSQGAHLVMAFVLIRIKLISPFL